MKFLRKFADSSKEGSLANKFRKKRFEIFRKMLSEEYKDKITILDIGGTTDYWKQMNPPEINRLEITILNIHDKEGTNNSFRYIKGSAAELNIFKENQFDIVFSNSVIEHLSPGGQSQMAKDLIRIGRRMYLQTPSYYFPVEPHFLFPFFQFLPQTVKILLIRKFNLGWYKKQENKAEAICLIKSINLLKLNQIKKLFPLSNIIKERLILFTKSYIVIK
jgi:hypothetical protein